ncbi:MAG: hypothetical protein HY586_01225 [Candidatus Omnitrophica bacterium]|nr:hypothetical protein [Candidatus Omnitrophota bacterium]
MKKFLITVIVAAALLSILSFAVLPLFVARPDVQNYLKTLIHKKAGDRVVIDKVGLGFFPSVFIQVKGVKVYAQSEARGERPLFEAGKVNLHLRILPLLFKKFEAGRLIVDEGVLHWQTPEPESKKPRSSSLKSISVTGIKATARNLGLNQLSHFRVQGELFGNPSSVLRLDGDARVILADGKPRLTELTAHFDIQNLLSEHLEKAGLIEEEHPLDQGEADLAGNIRLAPEGRVIDGDTKLVLSKILFREPEKNREASFHIPVDVAVATDFQWNPQTRVLKFEESGIDFPGMDASVSGSVRLLEKPELDISLRLRDIDFDTLNKNFPQVLSSPRLQGIHFSGHSTGSLILKGIPSQLLLDARMDGTGASVTFPEIIQKPEGREFAITFQCNLTDNTKVSHGELNGRLGGMAIKGSVENLDLTTWDGDANFITNKFPLAEWNGMIPALGSNQISGGGKIVCNIAGRWNEPRSLQGNAHITLDSITLHQGGRVLITGISSAIDVDRKEALVAVMGQAAVGAGTVSLQATLAPEMSEPEWNAHLETRKVPIETLTRKPFLTGNLDSTADYAGRLGSQEILENSLVGKGVYQLTGGEIQGFSLAGVLQAIPGIFSHGNLGRDSGSTRFDSLHGNFLVQNRTWQFPSIQFQSDIANAQAEGACDFDHRINFRGVMELAPGIGGFLSEAVASGAPLRFPFQIGGTFEHPQFNITETILGSNVVTGVLDKAFGIKRQPTGPSTTTTGGAAATGSKGEEAVKTAAQLLSSLLNQ